LFRKGKNLGKKTTQEKKKARDSTTTREGDSGPSS